MQAAVNISNQSIKVVAAEQKKIKRWETVALPPGLIKDGQILQPDAIAKILDELFANIKLPRDRGIGQCDRYVVYLPHTKHCRN